MDILKAEIERKRKQIQKAEVVAPEKKYFRRGDLALKQQEEYWTKFYQKHAVLKDTSSEDHLCVGTGEALSLLEDDGKEGMSREEVVKRLRERAEPIKLFGESDREALRRLRKLEIEAPELKEGRRNDFKAALDQVDQEYLKEVAEGRLHEAGRHDVKVDANLASIEEITEMAKDLGKCGAKRDCEIIYAFFNYLIQRWGHDLNARPEKVKRSGEGKFGSARHKQTVEHIKTLFIKLQDKTIPDDIRLHLVPMTRFLLDRDYILANNAYMEMAIGNAPWPVGVTASGIHQRPGSEKAYVKNIAHVLNDETQRKYIQGLKRCMTKCQDYFPSDPSRCVDYTTKH